MVELFREAISLINLPFTVFLGIIILYWIFVIIGAVDIEIFNVDADVDVDADVGADFDADAEAGAGHFHLHLLDFLNIGEVPITAILSVMGFSGWIFSLMANHYFNPNKSGLIAICLLVPNLIISFLITGSVTRPLRKLLSPMSNEDLEDQKILYRVGIVLTSEVTSSFGQVEIKTKGAPITINARTVEDKVLKKGDQVIIYDEDKEKGLFFVEKHGEE